MHSKNVCLSTKFDKRLKKIEKTSAQFLNYFPSPHCFIRIYQPQKLLHISFQPFFEIVRKLYDKRFSIHLMYATV